MKKQLNFTEVNYYCHTEFDNPEQVIAKHLPTNLYLKELKQYANIILIKHINYTGVMESESIRYAFFKRKNSFWQLPFSSHRTIKKYDPDMVVVQGLIFPLQVISLRMKLGKKCTILLQHQGEVPYRRKRIFQKLADKCVNGYLFTSLANTNEWMEAGIIKDRNKCFEIPPATTLFCRQDKIKALLQTGMEGVVNFLWVGRLNANKDPFTVLSAFEMYFSENHLARLYMIYQEDDLLTEVQQMINQSNVLKERVKLVGKIQHDRLETWYSAADYIVSGSHREGGSYALMEAMACGCVPIVTTIPASMKMIDNGKAGFYFKTGDANSLYKLLLSLKQEEYEDWSQKAVTHFKEEMSAAAIAKKMLAVYEKLKTV
jgi:glycosyltransferase involved in cell wall biosynthesis